MTIVNDCTQYHLVPTPHYLCILMMHENNLFRLHGLDHCLFENRLKNLKKQKFLGCGLGENLNMQGFRDEAVYRLSVKIWLIWLIWKFLKILKFHGKAKSTRLSVCQLKLHVIFICFHKLDPYKMQDVTLIWLI